MYEERMFREITYTIAGTVRQDSDKVAEWGKTMAKDDDLAVYYVGGGSVSQGVATTLEAIHPNVEFLERGIIYWECVQKQ